MGPSVRVCQERWMVLDPPPLVAPHLASHLLRPQYGVEGPQLLAHLVETEVISFFVLHKKTLCCVLLRRKPVFYVEFGNNSMYTKETL